MEMQRLTKTEIDNVIISAEEILRDMFDVGEGEFLITKNRGRNKVEARRFLIYLLSKDFVLTNKQILKRIPSITNHATIIHHTRRLDVLMDVEKNLKAKYDRFRHRMSEVEMLSLIKAGNNQLVITDKEMVIKKLELAYGCLMGTHTCIYSAEEQFAEIIKELKE